MNRGKKIVVLAHCILNQNSVVLSCGKNMSDFLPFVKDCLEKNIGILQLPCPEFQLYGLKRWGHVKDQFEHQGFTSKSYEILASIVSQIIDYLDNGYEILKVYGIKCSPSCGIEKTCRGDLAGETSCYKSIDDINNRVRIVDESGIFMEIFKKMLEEKGIHLTFEDIDDWEQHVD